MEQSPQQLIGYSALSELGRHFSPVRTATTLNSDLHKSAPAWIQLHVFSALSFFKPQTHMHPGHITGIETSDRPPSFAPSSLPRARVSTCEVTGVKTPARATPSLATLPSGCCHIVFIPQVRKPVSEFHNHTPNKASPSLCSLWIILKDPLLCS